MKKYKLILVTALFALGFVEERIIWADDQPTVLSDIMTWQPLRQRGLPSAE
jgi:hypothetical protein